MKKIFKVIAIVFSFSILSAQNVTINYNSFTPTNACNVFADQPTINTSQHLTNKGAPILINDASNSMKYIKMNHNYNGSYTNQKGTAYRITNPNNFKKDSKYRIIVTARNGAANVPTKGVYLKLSFAPVGVNSTCVGQTPFNNDVGFSEASFSNTPYFEIINIAGGIGGFIDYEFISSQVTTTTAYMMLQTYSAPSPEAPTNPEIQEIFIQKIQIIEIPPVFNINPTQQSISCNNTSSKTFSVVNVNNTTGTISYNWNVGTGWSRNGSPVSGTLSLPNNSITLTPTSPTILPSSVSVTPILNSVAQPTKTCSVTRASFTSSAMINGLTSICSGSSVYTISGAGTNSVTWSSSNTAIATISNANSTSVTLTKVGNGSVNLIATLTNACNQTVPIIKTVNFGTPTLTGLVSGPTCVGFGQTVTYTFNGSSNFGGNSYQWSVDAPIDDSSSFSSPNNCSWKYLGTQGSSQYVFKTGCIPTIAVVRVKINTTCGSSNYAYLYVTVNETGNCNNKISNIIQDDGNYASYYIDEENNNEIVEKVSDDNTKYFARIYDFNGNKVKEFISNDYDLSNLKSGIYILKLDINDEQLTSKIVVK
ncbi:MAG: T9SS type A sorting domain-containing protein [Flavobacteriales bacterium]|nr:T9SS type A sorting domain-containing protein [Flavobacteriales bacterium]